MYFSLRLDLNHACEIGAKYSLEERKSEGFAMILGYVINDGNY